MRFHSIPLQIVLITVIVNGIAPDSQSLASLRSIQLFCPIEGSPFPWDDKGNSPDELSAPAQVRRILRDREQTDDSSTSWFEPAGSPLPLTRHHAAMFDCGRGSVARFDCRNRLLCRLDC